jgi:hypothetical protein
MSGWDKNWIRQWVRSLCDPAFSSTGGAEHAWVEVTVEELANCCPLTGEASGKLTYLRELTRRESVRVLQGKLAQCRKPVSV